VLRLHPVLAPYKVAVLPLVKKDTLPEIARSICDQLRFDFQVTYDEKDTVGRRYRRQDAIGTPYCVTVDNETLSDSAVTIRERDSMRQERIPVDQIGAYISGKLSWRNVLA
jgi:glycyl-tRNA synthetase